MKRHSRQPDSRPRDLRLITFYHGAMAHLTNKPATPKRTTNPGPLLVPTTRLSVESFSLFFRLLGIPRERERVWSWVLAL